MKSMGSVGPSPLLTALLRSVALSPFTIVNFPAYNLRPVNAIKKTGCFICQYGGKKIAYSYKGGNMKTMTCKQLGGACEKQFHANSFEEMAELSKQHGIEMFQEKDEAHLKAMDEMKELMKNPEAMKDWFENKKKEFDELPEN